MQCKTCSTTLGRGNKSGYCRAHVSAALAKNAGHRQRQREGIRRKIAADPVYLDNLRQRARKLSDDPAINADRSDRFRAGRYWEIGAEAARQPEVRAKAGRKASATKLSWCPAHLRSEYLHLVRSKRLKAADARAMILDQHDRDMARWRRVVGITAESQRAA